MLGIWLWIQYDWPVNWKNRQKLALNIPRNGQKYKRTAKKNTKSQLKIAKKWPKYHLDHENYSPNGATGETPSWIPENIPKYTDKMAKNAIK